jgi:hypothetical protein
MDIVNTVNGVAKEILEYLIFTLFIMLYQWHIKANVLLVLKAPSQEDITSSILNIGSIHHFKIIACYLVTRISKLFMASEVFWQKLFQSGSVQVMDLSPGDNRDDKRTSWGRNSGRTSSFTRRAAVKNWFSKTWTKWSQNRQWMSMCHHLCVWNHYILFRLQNQTQTQHNMMTYVHISHISLCFIVLAQVISVKITELKNIIKMPGKKNHSNNKQLKLKKNYTFYFFSF